mmetsp:Transcript_6450/g.19372  ORF Transcript_6450/g.19372 Transcript_6450/m.19372 type:complete len:210 (-) Transcript_6450:628-1257(-)
MLGHHVSRRGLACQHAHARHQRRALGGTARADGYVSVDDTQHVQQLPFVLVDALALHIKQRVRVELQADGMPDVRHQLELIGALGAPPLVLELRVASVLLEAPQQPQVGGPCLSAKPAREQPRESGVGAQQPAARRDAVSFVLEHLGPQRRKVGEEARADQPRVELCHAVDRVRAHYGQRRHTHRLGLRLLDNAHARQPLRVVGPGLRN